MSNLKNVVKPRSDFSIADFPTMERAAKHYDSKTTRTRYHEHLLNCVAELAKGVEAGAIRNVIFVNAKHTLGSLIYHVWSTEMRDKVWANEAEWDQATKSALNFIPFSGINDIRSLGNKLQKLKQPGSHKDELQGFVDELSPLVDAVEFLKSRLIKGRAPSTKPAVPANPDKDVKTCPCCFRSIAVRGGKMVHHGYERPGNGQLIGNCWGVAYAPLETSTEGLEWLIGFHDNKLKEDKFRLQELPQATSISILVQYPKVKLETYTPDHKDWKKAYDIRKGELEGDIRNRKFNLGVYRRHLQDWIKWHLDHGRTLDIPADILVGAVD
jgi:hypothetical protein